VVLVGAPGAGKTSVGAELARRWGVDLRDTDALVEAAQGVTVSDIFVEHGEARFRELEEAAVEQALQAPGAVVALGGGAVLSERTRTRLAGRPVVFLDVSLAASASRVGLGVSRPLLLGNVRGRLKRLLDERRPLYLEVSRATVPTDDRTVAQVADEIEELFACRAT
jgi:shikimate kinase